MTLRHVIWKVGEKPTALPASELTSEQQLESMIVAAPSILNEQWMLIGRQLNAGPAGRIDLLAIAPDGALILIELKRSRSPRDVVAQAIDYATFVQNLKAEEIAAIYSSYAPGQDLAADFQARFGQPLDEEALNASHQIVIVAASIDESTARIVSYPNDRDLAINVLCFQVFANGEERFLSRAWLVDPAQTQVNAAVPPGKEKEPWNGEIYASFGESRDRTWSEAVRYGFISAGGGPWYSNSLRLLDVGDRIWVKAPGHGFVGVGRVKGQPVPAGEFKVSTPTGDRPALEELKANYHRQFAFDSEKAEYFVPVEWLQTVPLEQAI